MSVKRGKFGHLLHLVWIVPVGSLMWLFASSYYISEIDDKTTAKPQAMELEPYIKKSGGLVLHTYNRNAGGPLNLVSSPSFEYYIEYSDTSLERRAKEVVEALSGLGYKVQYGRFTAENSFCMRYGYSSHLPDGQVATEKSKEDYCRALSGVDSLLLLGATENEKRPYFTIYGENDDRTVFIEISDRTFNITSNDFWREEYSKRYGVGNEIVRSGHSMMTVNFARKAAN